MSLRLSIKIPIEHLPAPVTFVESLSQWWQRELDCQGEENVRALPLWNNVTLVICPQLEEHGEERWLNDRSYTFYLSNLSTRGLEVWYNEDEFIVRILSMSSPLEWELAFQIIEFAVDGENALVATDWEPAQLRLHEIRDVFDSEKINDAIYQQIDWVFSAVSQDGQIVNLPGPIMDCHIGPWVVVNTIRAFDGGPGESVEHIAETLFAMMCMVNYVGVNPLYENHQVPRFSTRIGENGEEQTAAAIEPGQAYLIPEVDFLVFTNPNREAVVAPPNKSQGKLMDFSPPNDDGVSLPLDAVKENLRNFSNRNGDSISLPQDKLKSVLGGFFQQPDELMWFDEYMFALSPIEETRFDEFMEYARSESSQLPPRASEPSWITKRVKAVLNLVRR
jgi:hypothetical protein